jgi:hypothetical protein
MFFGRKNPETGDSSESPPVIRVGGQAVIEGVMMRSPKSMAVAVRKPNGEIVVKRQGLTFFSERSLLGKLPLLRGVLTLVSALVLGIQALNFSANQALSEEEQETSSWTMNITFAVALCFGIFLFFLVPLYLTKWMRLSPLSLGHLLFKRDPAGLSVPWRRTQVDFCFRSRRGTDGGSGKGVQLSSSKVRDKLSAHRNGGQHSCLCPDSPLPTLRIQGGLAGGLHSTHCGNFL